MVNTITLDSAKRVDPWPALDFHVETQINHALMSKTVDEAVDWLCSHVSNSTEKGTRKSPLAQAVTAMLYRWSK